MDWLLRLLLRLVLVPLGVIAGFIVTIVVVLVGDWQLNNVLAELPSDQAASAFENMTAAAYLLIFAVIAMWSVAAIGILFAEAFAVRSWIFHTANGAVSAWISTSFFAPYEKMPAAFDGDMYVIASGLAGGLAYWAVAGWSAGFWKPVFAERLPPPPPATPLPPPQASTLPPLMRTSVPSVTPPPEP